MDSLPQDYVSFGGIHFSLGTEIRIERTKVISVFPCLYDENRITEGALNYGWILSQLFIAESLMVIPGKRSGLIVIF